jgi:hypothetical protein
MCLLLGCAGYSEPALFAADFNVSSGTKPAVTSPFEHVPQAPQESDRDLVPDRQVRIPRRTRCAAAAPSANITTNNCQSIPDIASL